MHYQKVKFRLNKALDKEMAIEFLISNFNVGGINFPQHIFETHPKIKSLIFE